MVFRFVHAITKYSMELFDWDRWPARILCPREGQNSDQKQDTLAHRERNVNVTSGGQFFDIAEAWGRYARRADEWTDGRTDEGSGYDCDITVGT